MVGASPNVIQEKGDHSFVTQNQTTPQHDRENKSIFIKSKKMKKEKADLEGPQIQFKLIKEIVASDSGPISLQTETDGQDANDDDVRIPKF